VTARASLATAALAAGLAAAGCAARAFVPPTGPSAPFPDYEQVFAQATVGCRGVRSFTAELSLSGRSGAARLRGRVLSGFASPASLRLEGVAPFGAPVFILAARPEESVLLLPREDRVIRGPSPAQILDALVGIDLGPDDLRSILIGCVAPEPKPLAGAQVGRWLVVDLGEQVKAYLRAGRAVPMIEAAQIGPFLVEYNRRASDFPERVRLRSAAGPGGPETDITVRISQLETNVTLGSEAFRVVIPASATPMTIDELRRAGPLGGQSDPGGGS
jgi:hypothetical protein